MMPGGSISDMIDQLSKVTAAGLPLVYYNPYGFPSYSPQLQTVAPQAVQQQMIIQPAEATIKTESSMEEWLLAAIQKLVNKGGANKRCRYDGCEIRYKDCIAKKADMAKDLIKFNHIKQKLIMPDGSELPKGSGYLRPRVEKWHEEHRGASASINMIATSMGMVCQQELCTHKASVQRQEIPTLSLQLHYHSSRACMRSTLRCKPPS